MLSAKLMNAGGVTMVTRQHRRAAGVFSSLNNAERAVTELKNAGFDMSRVSVIVKDTDRISDVAGVDTQKNVGNQADEAAAAGAVTGGILGGITGLFVGLGTLAIPGVGPILLAGELATTLATTAAGAGIGAAAGGLLGALVGLGIPEERARVYSDRISSGDYLVIVEGTDEEIRRAESILRNRGIEEFGVYNAPGVSTTADEYVNPAASSPLDSTVTEPKVIVVDRRDETT